MKYDAGAKNEPRWPAAYALLRQHAAFAQTESEKLTRTLAIMWMLGHGDLHRKNLGMTHLRKDGQRHIRVAPMYDVSSAIGTRFDQTLAIGIARQQRFSGIGVRQWVAHAKECGLDPDRTLHIVRKIATHAPDAIAAARTTVRARDENRHQSSVDRRAEEMIRYAERRRRVFIDEMTQRRRKASSAATRELVGPSQADEASKSKAVKTPTPPPRGGFTH